MKKLNDLIPATAGSGNFLHGSDLPMKTNEVVVTCIGLREPPPDFRSPAIMDIEPVSFKGKVFNAIALNKTNLKLLAKEVGELPLDQIYGEAKFLKVLVNNPSTGQATFSLRLESFKLKRRPKKKEDDEVPF